MSKRVALSPKKVSMQVGASLVLLAPLAPLSFRRAWLTSFRNIFSILILITSHSSLDLNDPLRESPPFPQKVHYIQILLKNEKKPVKYVLVMGCLDMCAEEPRSKYSRVSLSIQSPLVTLLAF